MHTTDGEFVTVAEVARRLRVNRMTVTRWIEQGLLVGYKVGGLYRIGADDLEAFVAAGRVQPKAAGE